MRPQRVSDMEIEQAAAAAFLEHGPAASLASIAATLGITQPGLLHRVGSKEALLMRALCPGVPEAVLRLNGGPGQGSVVAELEEALAGLLAFLNEALPALSVLRFSGIDIAQVLQPGPPPPVAARTAVADWLGRCGDQIACRLPPQTTAELLLAGLEARAMNRHLAGQPTTKAQDTEYVRTLVTALIEESS